MSQITNFASNGGGSSDGGRVEQIVQATNSTLQSCVNPIPNDDTIPQITEGDEILSLSITPKSASNKLIIDIEVPFYASSPSVPVIFALFQDLGPDAIASLLEYYQGSNFYPNTSVKFSHQMIAGTTSPITFSVRAGIDTMGSSVILNCNGDTLALALGGTESAIIRITEFRTGLIPGPLPLTLTGDTGGPVSTDVFSNIDILGGPGIIVDGTPLTNTLTISSTASIIDATLASYNMVTDTTYITDRAAGVSYLLPAASSVGDQLRVVGNTGTSTITQGAGQQICVGNLATTLGVAGSLSSTNDGDCLEMICIASGASTIWRVTSSMGNWAVV